MYRDKLEGGFIMIENSPDYLESFSSEHEVHKKNHPGWIYGRTSIIKENDKQYYLDQQISFQTNKIIAQTKREITNANYKIYNINDI